MKMGSMVGWHDARRIARTVDANNAQAAKLKAQARANAKPAQWFEVHSAPRRLDRFFIDGANALDHARRTGGFIWTVNNPAQVYA